MNRYRLTFNPAPGRVGWYGEILDEKLNVLRTSTDARGPLSKLGLEALGPNDEAVAVKLVTALEPMIRILTADQQAKQDVIDARKAADAALAASRAADHELDLALAQADARVSAARKRAKEAEIDAKLADDRARALERSVAVDPDLDKVSDLTIPADDDQAEQAADPLAEEPKKHSKSKPHHTVR